MEVTGQIKVIGNVENVSDKFKKRQIVLEMFDNPEYPETVVFELQGDKVTLGDKFKVGQHVTMQVNLRGRKWTNKEGKDVYFNTLQAWRIDEAGATLEYAISQPVDNQQDGLPF